MPEGVISTYESGVDLVVEWKIHNFLNLSENDCAWYTSSYFSFGGERWRLRIFPNGWSLIDSSGHIDLCLCKRDSNRSIKQSFSLSLKTVRREKYNEQHCTKDFYDDAHKFIRFIQRSDLIRRRSQLLPDGVLTVVCTMKSSTSAVSASNTVSASAECCYCKRTFNADSLSSHQKKCMHRPTKCPECFEVVVLEKWLNEHECQQERPEAGKEHKENSENTGVNASTQTEEKDMKLLEAKSEIDELKLNYNQALQDKAEVQTKLRVLTNNFKDKEIQLQRQLSAREADRQKKEDDVNSAKRRIMLIQQENASYQSQIAELKQEMEKKERTLKSQIAAQEKKADENRIAACAAERNLENMEQVVTQLRQRLTLLEQEQENCANAARDEIISPVLKTCVEACTQTQKNVHRHAYTQTVKEEKSEKGLEQYSEITCVEACTQTKEENKNSENICLEASTRTREVNADEWFKEKSRKACVDTSIHTEEQNEEIKELSIAELDKTDTSEGAESDESETSRSNKTATKTKENVSLISLPAERDLMTDVTDLMKEGRGIDVTFEVDTPNAKTEFFAHQLILALRSPYFADLFYGQGRNKGYQIIPLKGINTKAFEHMIRHCYDYKPYLRTTEDACALFKVAFEFKVISLQNLCHAFVRHTNIEPGNVFSILKISEEMEDQSLQDMCYKILQEKTREVMANYELCDVTSAMVYALLNLPKLSLNSEYELIKLLFDWAKVKSEDSSSSKNAREYLEKYLKYMNLLALRFEEFAMLCKDNQEFFNPDEIGNISMNIAFPGTREMPHWYGKDLKCRVYTGSKE